MTEFAAHVRSVESLERLRHSLVEFRREVINALAILEMEIRRVEDWIERRQPLYWAEAVRRADHQLSQARLDLERCETAVRPDDRPSCHVERKAYEQARRRLAYCEQQQRVVRRWKSVLDREIRNLRGRLGKLTDVAETDVPRAVAALERMMAALANYMAVDQPPAEPLAGGSSSPPPPAAVPHSEAEPDSPDTPMDDGQCTS